MTPDVTTAIDRKHACHSPEMMDLDHLDDLEELLGLEATTNGSPPESPLAQFHAPLSPYYSRANAVHMEMQENARLPTLNMSVDRTNSGLPPRGTLTLYSPDTRRDIDEMMRLSEQDFSLTEVFLKSNHRSSRNLNYSAAGALMSSIGNRIGEGVHEDTTIHSLNPVTTARIETPASTPQLSGSIPSNNTTTGSVVVSTSQDQSRYAYGRPYQLPIPSTSETAIPPPYPASQTGLEVTAVMQTHDNIGLEQHKLPLLHSVTTPIALQYRPPYAPTLPGPAAPSYLQNASHAKSRAVPTASIAEATLRRSQFGFGGDHIVPSTVQPPSNRKKTKIPSPMMQSPPSPPNMNSGAAYERKKQRAKDSRVKLNEAIDNLSIAINLAGSQSKQRLTQLQALPKPTIDRKMTLDAMSECSFTAESAKKWERPSFVNTAATLVQNLNAQCEALMREVMELKNVTAHSSVLKRSDNSPAEEEQSPGKRRKLVAMNGANLIEETHNHDPVLDAFSEKTILLVIAKYLDPSSLLRCQCISRSIRNLGAFQEDLIWLQSALIARFGMFNVRQWKDKSDENSTSVMLYHKMDSVNVRPHSSEEGSIQLGEGQMHGKVSAWVTLVERSNGETCRSVKIDGKNEYTSLPVVELRYLIQNTGYSEIVIKEQIFGVDASTRRRGEEWKEINWDERFHKILMNIDGSHRIPRHAKDFVLCRLKLYESVIVVVHIQAKGCSTLSKFQQRGNFTKLLVNLAGTTLPLVVPFFRDGN